MLLQSILELLQERWSTGAVIQSSPLPKDGNNLHTFYSVQSLIYIKPHYTMRNDKLEKLLALLEEALGLGKEEDTDFTQVPEQRLIAQSLGALIYDMHKKYGEPLEYTLTNDCDFFEDERTFELKVQKTKSEVKIIVQEEKEEE